LTRGDAKFLASVGSDVDRRYDALEACCEDLCEAAEYAGVEPDLADLDALAEDEEAALNDRQRLDAVISGLSRQRGAIARGEFTTDTDTDTTEETSEDVQPE
jgi:hypothetical protein